MQLKSNNHLIREYNIFLVIHFYWATNENIISVSENSIGNIEVFLSIENLIYRRFQEFFGFFFFFNSKKKEQIKKENKKQN